jgi:hypothetical protein
VRATVQQPLSTRPVSSDALLDLVNYELRPFALQVRQALNLEYRTAIGVDVASTVGIASTQTFVLWTSDPMPTGAVWSLDARATAVTPGVVVPVARYDIVGLSYRAAAGAVLDGSSAVVISSAPEYTLEFAVSGNSTALTATTKLGGSLAASFNVLLTVREALV